MTRRNFLLKSISLILCVVCVLSGCNSSGESSSDNSDMSILTENYTVTVTTKGGMVLGNIGIYVYEDTTLSDLVWAGTADENGKVSFSAEKSESYAVVLRDVPDGFVVDNAYLLNEVSKTISLETLMFSENQLDRTYKLGDISGDFSVKAFDGREYSVSEILKTKKAVVLNFWFENCGPCKTEFPFMQEAYEEYREKIEILALNPIDGTDKSVEAFAEMFGLTFPMAAADQKWESALKLNSYPTTVIIDRYGMITMIHKGSITDKETFLKIFEYFTSDDYNQKLVRNLSDI